MLLQLMFAALGRAEVVMGNAGFGVWGGGEAHLPAPQGRFQWLLRGRMWHNLHVRWLKGRKISKGVSRFLCIEPNQNTNKANSDAERDIGHMCIEIAVGPPGLPKCLHDRGSALLLACSDVLLRGANHCADESTLV